jgi:hypothetical protein
VKKKLLILGGGLVILCGLFFDVNITYNCEQYFMDKNTDILIRENRKINDDYILITRIESISRTGRRYFNFEEGDRKCKYVFIKEPYADYKKT